MLAQRACLVGPRNLVFDTVELAEPKGHELLCQTLVSAISTGTEVAAYLGREPLRPGPAYPRLVGYCNVGRVLKAGSEVSSFSAGEVVLTLASHQSAYLIAESSVLARLPGGVMPEHASLSYLAQLGLQALQKADFRLGETVAVLGLGVIGLASVSLARSGGGKVIALGNHPSRLALALEMGAHEAWDSREEGLVERIGAGVDLVLTTVNSWEGWRLALQLARRGGRVAVLGFPGRDQSRPAHNPLDSALFYDKQLTLLACGMACERDLEADIVRFTLRRNMELILTWLAQGQLVLGPLVSRLAAWNQLSDVYERLASGEKSEISAVLQWS